MRAVVFPVVEGHAAVGCDQGVVDGREDLQSERLGGMLAGQVDAYSNLRTYRRESITRRWLVHTNVTARTAHV